jgi:hypothetical protein
VSAGRAWALPGLLASALVGAAALLTLAAPPSDPGRAAAACFHLIELPRGRQLVFGCDGFTFLRGAADPVLLLEPTFAPPSDFTYQSRPLHIGLAAALGRVLQPVAGLAVPADARYQGRTPSRRYAGPYAAYVLLNVGLLLAAGMALHDALIGLGRPLTTYDTVALLAGLAFLILSRMVKVWLFTPHTILWGILIPLWALATARRLLADGGPPPARTLLRASGASGLAALAYGFAVLVPATGAVALGVRHARTAGLRRGVWPWLRAVTPAAGLFLLPPLAWIGLSYVVSGGFYSHEAAEYRQFRWLPAAIAEGPGHAVIVAGQMAWQWTAMAVRELAAPTIVLAGLLVAARITGASLGELGRRLRTLWTAAATVLVLALAFWYLNGSLLEGRVTTLAPVVYAVAVAVALDVDRREGRVRWTGLLAALGLARGTWIVLGSPSF